MIAMLLSSIVIILVSGTFLVQSQYYSSQSLHVGVHDNARVATDRVASEIRSTMEGGFVVAGPRTLTVRSPLALAVVCDRAGTDVHVHFEGGASGLATDEFAGVAMLDPSTDSWEYQNVTWSSVNGGSAGSASACADNGADTSWAAGEFHEILGGGTMFSPSPNEGAILMLFRETTFKIQQSVLNAQTMGLFRQSYGEPLVEFASGMDSTAQFLYRTGGSTYADTVIGSSVASIDAVRIVADARLPARSGAMDDVTFGWSVNVAVRNAP
jgi:hypothetical protein